MITQCFISENDIAQWKEYLVQREMSPATVRKYLHDVRQFMVYLGAGAGKTAGSPIIRDSVLGYKQLLHEKGYAPRSINSMLIALNRFFAFKDMEEMKVKTEKIQTRTFCPEEKELSKCEYERLVRTAAVQGNERLECIIQTICGTGIRISELRFITAEAVKQGKAIVTSKGKTREVFLVKKLRRRLLEYIRRCGITSGPVFVTRSGKCVCRSNIWREMKSLCLDAGVDPAKVFPHNLRHLFARVFYGLYRDIAKLADILGHSNVETTRIYIISSGAEHRKCMERMHLII